MKKSLTVKQWVLIVLAICGGYAFLVFGSKATPEAEKPGLSRASIDAINRRCAVEAGFDPDSKHKITKEEMLIFTACIDIQMAQK